MTVCRYFLQGKCRFGDRCRFEHTDPYESNAYGNSSGNDYSYQNRGRQQPTYSSYNQGHDRQYNDQYTQNNYYSSQRNYKDERYGSNDSFSDTTEPDYYANKYNKNKLSWMSEDYKKQIDPKTPRTDSRFVNTSTPKSKTSFSFKDAEVHSRREHPNDLRMNEKNLIDAEIIKEDAFTWEFGNQWPFTCYCPNPGKSAFPGFVDLSPEELRLEAYNAKENNSYHSYVEFVEKALHEIKMKREQLKEPSVELMSIIEKIRRGEDFCLESVDGVVPSLSNLNQTSIEGMIADDSTTLHSTPASSFSFKTTPATFFGSQQTAATFPGSQQTAATVFGSQQTAASSFSFKTTLETDMGVKSSASSFSFKPPVESASRPSVLDADTDIYTPMDKISQQDQMQFSAPTFTLGKIPTVPPPQQMCL